jgi:EAL and modified HD-GYP domain-containing signal transduction protein
VLFELRRLRLRAENHTVRHVLAILSEREVRRWIRLLATLGAGQGKSSDLVLAALVRARFCEPLSPEIQHEDFDLFLMGMRSLMDTILKIPIRQVLDKVPIDQESKAVLLGATGPLQPFYQLILAQESGDWKVASALTAQLHLSQADIADAYWQAMQWAASKFVEVRAQARYISPRAYSELWNSMFSSTESCAGVPEVFSPERVAITRNPLELVSIS